MLYKVVKGAFSPAAIRQVERFALLAREERAATVEDDDYSTRDCAIRWLHHGTEGFEFARKHVFAALRVAGVEKESDWVCEDLQHTVYGPGHFHNWHIDAYRRTYNRFDLPLGERFIGKKRKISVSVLLNDSSEFTGGTFEISMFPNGKNTVGNALADFSEAGDVAVFDSSLCHRVAPIESGVRRSLVTWICA